MSSSSKLQSHGYNQEEMYFHKRELELIKNMKSSAKPTSANDTQPPQHSAQIIPLKLPTSQIKKGA